MSNTRDQDQDLNQFKSSEAWEKKKRASELAAVGANKKPRLSVDGADLVLDSPTTPARTPDAAAVPPPNGWAYEGIACYVWTSADSGRKPLYRAWNGSDHFYTTSVDEYRGLSSSYIKEGIACYVESSSGTAGLTSLFRFYNHSADDHLYTTSLHEFTALVRHPAWNFEGSIGYVGKVSDSTSLPLYRAYNHGLADHFYTTSDIELDRAAPILSGAQIEGLMRYFLQGYLTPGANFHIADGSYFVPRLDAVVQLMATSLLDGRTWTSQVFDCDDFAHLLKGVFIEDQYTSRRHRTLPYAFGIVWGNTPAHAMNFAIAVEKGKYKVYIIEPQNDGIYDPSAGKLSDIYYVQF